MNRKNFEVQFPCRAGGSYRPSLIGYPFQQLPENRPNINLITAELFQRYSQNPDFISDRSFGINDQNVLSFEQAQPSGDMNGILILLNRFMADAYAKPFQEFLELV